MRKYIIKVVLVLSIIVLVVVGFIVVAVLNNNKNPVENSKAVNINNQIFKVDIAETDLEKTMGLMYRKTLPENEGMFFIFDKAGTYTFWMANTFVDMDILWIDESMQIVHIQENAKSCPDPTKTTCNIYNPKITAKYVLEINAGLSSKFGFKVGHKVGRINF